MFWQTFLTTFLMVFLAELGDKTQLATMLLVTQSEQPWSVFIGAASALILTSFVGVIAGSALLKYIPPEHLQTGAGTAFIIIGILLFLGKL